MGIPDTSLLDLIEKVGSWIPWRGSHRPCLSRENEMPGNSCKMCCGCDIKFSEYWIRYHCQSCGRVLCGKCFEKIHPSASPRESPEPPSPCFGGEKTDGTVNSDSTVTSNHGYPSPVSVRRFYSRSDEEEAEDSGKHFFSLSGEYYQDNSDIDTSSVSARHEFYSFKSVGSSPSDSPSRIDFTSNRVGHSVQQERERSPRAPNDGSFVQDSMAILRRPGDGTEDPENTDDCSDDLAIFQDQCEKLQKPLDFENNGFIWFPPPADDEDDEEENNFFEYDDEDDDIGESGAMFSSSTSLASMFPAKEKQNEGHKEPLRAVVQGHFRALVSQLLQGEGIKVGKEDNIDEWLDIVATVAWQAANFVKPDTSRGGSMDPGAYVKVKCIASGSPHESTLVKGVVCTKNIKHKRMTSQYKTPRLLILGGALEYQRVPNQLASFNTLLQQEMDHLRMIVSKIEAHRTNVLLVEKSVSSYAQEYLLEKDISLVLNVKRPLLERIARCTGALITPSVDDISMTRLGHCELFRVERVSEELETANQSNKKPSKTLMFFEGCPRRLGCTVLLKGACREELKKVKHVVQYAVFAAYHLSLETSFLADEGASLPKMTLKPSITIPDRTTADNVISSIPHSAASTVCQAAIDAPAREEGSVGFNTELGGCESSSEHINPGPISPLSPDSMDGRLGNIPTDAHNDDLASSGGLESYSLKKFMDLRGAIVLPADFKDHSQPDLQDTMIKEEMQPGEIHELAKPEQADENEVSSEYFSGTDSHQSILVSFSSRSVRTGTVCERSRLMRIKFYGCFDKPLGRYLRDDLFDQTPCCSYCREPADAHVQCYTHQQGSLTINVKCLPSMKLPGERDGKIWMWHRCLRCAQIDGVPPATRRVFMSDAAWGLSFGKFLELSFSNHATANRVATCGHSLQRDCLRFYGFGSMVAFFRYSPIDILSVHLPPAMLEFNGQVQQEWIRKEASELLSKIETVYVKISDVLDRIEQKTTSFRNESSDKSELHNHIMDLKDLLNRERNDYNNLLQPSGVGASPSGQVAVDILELNCLRRSLLIGSHVWDQRLKNVTQKEEAYVDEKNKTLLESIPSPASNLSDKIDSAWTGTDQLLMKPQFVHTLHADGNQAGLPPSSLHLVMRTYSQLSPREAQKVGSTSSFFSSSHVAEGARLLLPQTGHGNLVIAVYDNEPTSIISYALSSKKYEDWVADKLNEHEGDLDYIHYGSKVKFSVTCYFAKQFDTLRKKCCPNEVDFVRSLSRCKRWSAQGGKSNVYFAKSLDERFIIKQVTKTELVSFEKFAHEYFKYLTHSLSSGSPTCLAKILGIYQVTVKNLKGGKETKMDLMVMENLFFKRNISRVYDLKGSARCRYNADTTGANKVLLDTNLLETLCTKPIFLGSKAKRSLERAIWNDTSFLASVDVMDYSLLVGVDNERKELVLGIIDFMRQYTWDKHLETWVKASGILGGPKNAPPTIISPIQYKRRFRKAMTTYFLAVPDQWSS
ncbi:unnamed protein product, partial [Vitis vinifera]